MATHVVCPLCGKSSSLKMFPSVGGTELLLQSFRGRGRGKGFEAVPAGSGLTDKKLAMAVHDRLIEIIRTLEAHGLPVAVVPASPISEQAKVRERVAELERELGHERASSKLLEGEVDDLESELDHERTLRFNTLAQVGRLSQQLDHAKSTQAQLLAASRQCVASLRVLRENAKGTPFATHSLAPIVYDLKTMLDLVHEMRFVSSTMSASTEDAVVER